MLNAAEKEKYASVRKKEKKRNLIANALHCV